MKTCLVALSCCITMIAMLAYAQTADEGYQMARVVAIERVAANAQHMENEDNYKISMRLGDTRLCLPRQRSRCDVYGLDHRQRISCQIKRPKGKVLLVKNSNGQIVEMNIVGKKTPK